MRKQILKHIICYLEWLQIFFNSHLDGNWKRNDKFPRPFLQTQVYLRARSS